MKNKMIAIVGHVGLSTTGALLVNKLKDMGDVELITPDEARERGFSINKPAESEPQPCKLSELSFPNTESVYNYRKQPVIPQISSEKEFICKGKHQYRDNGEGIWVCECGKTI